MISNKDDTTYITGFWHIKGNTKRDIEHYLKSIPGTLDLLKDKKVVLFYDDEKILDFFKKHLKTNNFKAVKRKIEELPTHKISKDYLESCKNSNVEYLKKLNEKRLAPEKGYLKYFRDYKKSGEDVFKKTFTVWTSKIYLVEEIIDKNPFNSEFFAWVDASVSRFNNKRKKWDFAKIKFSDKWIYHYDGNIRLYGKKQNVNTGFLFAHKKRWLKFIPQYKSQIKKSADDNYGHDDESLVNLVQRNYPSLFKKINKIDAMKRYYLKNLFYVPLKSIGGKELFKKIRKVKNSLR